MKLIERDEGEYRIFAGAMEGSQGDGFIAAVVVSLRSGSGRPARDVFRDDALACGHRWSTLEMALAHAVIEGQEAIWRERNRCSCSLRNACTQQSAHVDDKAPNPIAEIGLSCRAVIIPLAAERLGPRVKGALLQRVKSRLSGLSRDRAGVRPFG